MDYIEAYGNYCKLHLIESNKFMVVNYKISDLAQELAPKKFSRVHKSYIVNQNFVNKVSNQSVFINGKELPLGDTFKKNFLGNFKAF